MVPHLDNELRYNGTEFTLYKNVNGVTLGASSEVRNGKLKDLRNTDFQFGKFWKGSNVTGNINFGSKTGKISFQKNFR